MIALPFELCSFPGLESITFEGINYITSKAHIKYRLNVGISAYRRYSDDEKSRPLILHALRLIYKQKSGSDVQGFMTELKKEFALLENCMKTDAPIQLIPVGTARKKIPTLTSITWRNIINNSSLYVVLESPECFRIFETLLTEHGSDFIGSIFKVEQRVDPKLLQSNAVESERDHFMRRFLSNLFASYI